MKSFRIVWAVDPLGEEKEFQIAAAGLLQSIAGRLDAEVYPVYLYGGYPLEFPVYSPPIVTDAAKREMNERLAEILKGCELKKMSPLEVLVKPYVSLGEGVDRFVERANALDADLILATTHARKGVTRWLIGSFAEALMEKSSVPVLIANPEGKTKWDLVSVVFATDFSEGSKKAFLQILPVAKAFNAEICLYHKLTHFVTPLLGPAFFPESLDSKILQNRLKECEKLAEEWERIAKDADVRIQTRIDPRLPATPAEATIETAHQLHAWIAIAAQSGPLARALLGSNARRIIRNADIPVWVHRSK